MGVFRWIGAGKIRASGWVQRPGLARPVVRPAAMPCPAATRPVAGHHGVLRPIGSSTAIGAVMTDDRGGKVGRAVPKRTGRPGSVPSQFLPKAVQHYGQLVAGQMNCQARHSVGQQHPFAVLHFDPQKCAQPAPKTGAARTDPWRPALVNRMVGRVHSILSHGTAPCLSASVTATHALRRLGALPQAKRRKGGNRDPVVVAIGGQVVG